MSVQVVLEVCIAQLVARFLPTVILALLLHSVVREVDHGIRDVSKAEGPTRCPYVALSVIVGLEIPVDARGEGVGPNVELSLLVEKRIMDILLHDPSPARGSVVTAALDDSLNLLEVVGHLDAMPSICVLSRFDDPHVCVFRGVALIVP